MPDERSVERGEELLEAAGFDERRIRVERTFGVRARGQRVDVRTRRVYRRQARDPVVGVLPSRAPVGLSLLQEIDLGLHDEDRVDVPSDDFQKRRVAFCERLLRIDEVEHRVRRRQEVQRSSPVRGIDRG